MNYVDAFGWISTEPPIIRYALSHSRWDRVFPSERVYRFPFFHWHFTPDQVAAEYDREKTARPQDVFHYLTNDEPTATLLRSRGIPASTVNHNAFVDESIYRPIANTRKRFDAVYTAQMSPFKRHILAKDIKRLLIIDGRLGRGLEEKYFDNVRTQLPTATFTHYQHPNGVPPSEVATYLNQSAVGLCLSAEEGAMYASIEYPLCGLPVVSTASRGGRSTMFHPSWSKIVADDPQQISLAVSQFMHEELSPAKIREAVIEEMTIHRKRFWSLLQQILDAEGCDFDALDLWSDRFFNKWIVWEPPEQVALCFEKMKRR